jgi:hypothetical protein
MAEMSDVDLMLFIDSAILEQVLFDPARLRQMLISLVI